MQTCRNIVKENVHYPANMSEACKDIISKLLERDVTKRLRLTHCGAGATRSHAWFKDLNWDAIYKKTKPSPYRPRLANPLNTFDYVDDDSSMVPPHTEAKYEIMDFIFIVNEHTRGTRRNVQARSVVIDS